MNIEELKIQIEYIKSCMPNTCGAVIDCVEAVIKASESLPELKHHEVCSKFICYCNMEGKIKVLDDCTLAVAKHYVRKSSLPSVEDMVNIISLRIFNESLNENKPFRNLELYGVAKAIRKLITGGNNEEI